MTKIKKTILLVLIIFTFYYFLTISIPPFWEDHSFNQRFIQTPITTQINHIFKIGNENIFDLERPFLGLYFHLTFALFKYNFFWHQLTKIIFTAFSSLLLFSLLCTHLKSKNLAFAITLFSYLSYPVFSNFLQYDNPFVFAQFFKVAAIYFLLKDITKEKTNPLNQVLVLLFAVLAFRSYNQAWSIVGVIILFTLFYKLRYLKRYAFLFVALITYNFPLNITSIILGKTTYSNVSPTIATFFKFFYTTPKPLYVPFFMPESLYYVSLLDVLSFFGIALIILLTIFFVIKIYNDRINPVAVFTSKAENRYGRTNMLFTLCITWIICEVPLWYFAPDPTVRYLSGIMPPLFILLFISINNINTSLNQKLKKYFLAITSALLIGFLLTNIGYAYLFRITWGSAFIGYSKANDFIEETRGKNTYVLYYFTSPARNLFPLDKKSNNYEFKTDVIYNQSDDEGFSEKNINLLKKKYKEVYVIKSKSAFGNSEYPPVPIEKYKNLNQIKVILGKEDDVIDKITEWLTKKLNINYLFYTFTVYKAV